MPASRSWYDHVGDPAIAAWRRLAGGTSAPDRVQILKASAKSHVYRLTGLPNLCHAVIGKRCELHTAQVERAVYERIMPGIPVPSPRYLGFVHDDADAAFGWIFLEDAGDDEPAELMESLLAPWLARCHMFGSESAQRCLPARDASYYLAHLRGGRDRLVEFITTLQASADTETLRRLIDACDSLEADWPRVWRVCTSVPSTLVHGDLARKHMRVRRESGAEHLLVLDWETAGWGSPAPDLEKLATTPKTLRTDDPARQYLAMTRWSGIEPRDLERLARVGSVLRTLAGIDWASQSLGDGSDEKQMWKMRAFDEQLAAMVPAILENEA